MIIPDRWENKSHVPNHQPDDIYLYKSQYITIFLWFSYGFPMVFQSTVDLDQQKSGGAFDQLSGDGSNAPVITLDWW